MTAVNEGGNHDDAHECPQAKQRKPMNPRTSGIGAFRRARGELRHEGRNHRRCKQATRAQPDDRGEP